MAKKKQPLTPEEKLAQALVPKEQQPYELPKGWVWTRVKEITTRIKRGRTPKYVEKSEVLVFAQKCNQKDGTINLDKAQYLNPDNISKYAPEEYLIDLDTVINSTGTGTLGRVGLYKEADNNTQLKVVPDTHVTIVRAKHHLNPFYMNYYLLSLKNYLEQQGSGSTNQKELKPDTIGNLLFSLPPLPEQQRIVARIESLFAKLDAAREKLQQVLSAQEARRSAILHEAFTGWLTGRTDREKEWIVDSGEKGSQNPEGTEFVPEGWKKVSLGDAYDLKAGKNIKAKEINEKKDSLHSYPCYGGNGIRGYVQAPNRKGLHPIIGRQGALCGNVNMADGEFYATEHAVVVTDKIPSDAIWTYYYLTYLNLNQYATSTAQPGLAVSNLNKIWIILPPLEVQHKVSKELISLFHREDAIKKAAQSALSQINLLKKSILARAFRGQLGTQDPSDPDARELLL